MMLLVVLSFVIRFAGSYGCFKLIETYSSVSCVETVSIMKLPIPSNISEGFSVCGCLEIGKKESKMYRGVEGNLMRYSWLGIQCQGTLEVEVIEEASVCELKSVGRYEKVSFGEVPENISWWPQINLFDNRECSGESVGVEYVKNEACVPSNSDESWRISCSSDGDMGSRFFYQSSSCSGTPEETMELDVGGNDCFEVGQGKWGTLRSCTEKILSEEERTEKYELVGSLGVFTYFPTSSCSADEDSEKEEEEEDLLQAEVWKEYNSCRLKKCIIPDRSKQMSVYCGFRGHMFVKLVWTWNQHCEGIPSYFEKSYLPNNCQNRGSRNRIVYKVGVEEEDLPKSTDSWISYDVYDPMYSCQHSKSKRIRKRTNLCTGDGIYEPMNKLTYSFLDESATIMLWPGIGHSCLPFLVSTKEKFKIGQCMSSTYLASGMNLTIVSFGCKPEFCKNGGKCSGTNLCTCKGRWGGDDCSVPMSEDQKQSMSTQKQLTSFTVHTYGALGMVGFILLLGIILKMRVDLLSVPKIRS